MLHSCPSLAALGVFVFSSGALAEPGADGSARLRVIGELHLEPQAEYLGTRIGGISGIDYDPAWGYLVVLTDDAGRRGPARAYLGRIELAPDRIVGLDWSYLLRMTWGTGEVFAPAGLDLEAVRFIPHNDYFGEPSMLITSEGDPDLGAPPMLYEFCSGATRMDEWPAPDTHAPAASSGVHRNRAFEAAAVVGDRLAVVATEQPLKQDSPTGSANDWIRFSTYDLADPLSGPIAEIVYPLGRGDPEAVPGMTGLVELVALDGGRLLSVERTLTALGAFDVRLYLVDPAGASDVLGVPALDAAEFTPARKTLIASLGDLVPNVYNVEAACFGPDLTDGTRTLLLANDSDFLSGVPTVFTALAIEDDGGVLSPVVIDFDGEDSGP
jgi:3-phytase